MTEYSDEAIKQALSLVQEIENQTDRGAAIVGAAWVEEELHAAIESFLEKDKAAWDRLFRKSGPLSSFSAKIDLARLLGMVSNVVASDLHILREIRNEFAHSVLDKDKSVLSFRTARIKDKCLALRSVKHEEIHDPRVAFIRACAVLNSDFYLHKLVSPSFQRDCKIRAKCEDAA
jgi:DNA-binding MltR family transcriptional regulator